MLTLGAVYPRAVESARQILLSDLDSISFELEIAGFGVKTIRPFARKEMTPIVDDMIGTVMSAATEAIKKEVPVLRRKVRSEAGAVAGRIFLATTATGIAMAFLIIAAAKV